MREFLYSEVGNYYSIPNIPVHPDIAIEQGKKLALSLLEPLQDHFGRLHIRSGYRSPTLNLACNEKGLGCKSNVKNYARHIWDIPNEFGQYGAMACVVISGYADEGGLTGGTKPIEEWIKRNLNYSELIFFKKQGAFNIGRRGNLF